VKSNHYDVVVVGAGPSGSLCARNLARAGYQVLLCEKRPVVGFPVRCGEATGPRQRLSDFMTVNEDYMETTITGAIMHAPGGTTIRYDAGRELGTMLDRTLFDQDVANQAVREGAELQTNARVMEVSGVVDGKRTLQIEQDGKAYTITTSMVVGADGAESLVGRKAGFKTRQTPPGSCTAIELRVRVMDPNPHHLTFWSGQDTINNGYVWVFPKVKSGVVNLGCGEQIPKLGAKSMLEIAMEFKERLYPGAEVEAVHGGCVPVSGNLEEYSTDRLLLCGAPHQPTHRRRHHVGHRGRRNRGDLDRQRLQGGRTFGCISQALRSALLGAVRPQPQTRNGPARRHHGPTRTRSGMVLPRVSGHDPLEPVLHLQIPDLPAARGIGPQEFRIDEKNAFKAVG
jgi:digeranylgeranylglycerophospholipid reductase